MASKKSSGSKKSGGESESTASDTDEIGVGEGGSGKASEPNRTPNRTPTRTPTSGDTTESRAPEQRGARHRRISEVAYQIAQKRGFEGGQQMDDWLQAESEIDEPSDDE